MQYVIAPNNAYQKTVDDSAPCVFDATHFCIPSDLTMEEKLLFGVMPLSEVAPAIFNPIVQACIAMPPAIVDGAWEQQWAVIALDFATAQANLLSQLEPQRMIKQNAGLAYAFPDGSGVIQTRDATQYQDLTFIAGYNSIAMILSQQGVSAMPVGFIDQSNAEHALTPAQAITMCLAVGNFVGGLVKTKQTMRATILALTAETIGTFDITKGW